MDNVDKKIEELILNGILEVSAIDIDTGQPLYTFTNKLKEYDEDLYNMQNNYFFQEMTSLWEKGFIDLTLFDNDPSITITDKAWDQTAINELDDEQKRSLKEIKRITGEHGEYI
jgi:hypothetical protein